MSDLLLELRAIEKSFGSVHVLHGVDLDVRRGEVIGLIGENGAGKSTLMNIVAGTLAPSAGTMAFEGRPAQLRSVRDGRAIGISFVHQELSTVGALSIAENIFLGDYRAGPGGFVNYKAIRTEAAQVLERVGLGHIDPRTELGRLRTGEQQLIEIAKAIVEKPRLLILDEPTSSLTPFEAERLFALMKELSDQGTGLILITHRLEEALANCSRIVVLRDGRLISDRASATTGREQLIHDMVGKEATFTYRGGERGPGEVRLKVEGLKDKGFLAPIDLEVRAGEVVGLFGLVGAGRTEFLETLYGARPRTAGSVTLDGAPVAISEVTDAVKAGLFMLPEGRKSRGILPTHSVERNISISHLGQLARHGFVPGGAEREAAARRAETLNIKMGSIRQPITSLSGGNQQKALFGRALLADPRILLLDEPTHGVDVGAKSEIYDIIHGLADQGLGIIVASSELPEIMALADRCVVFAGGRIAGILSRDQMSDDAILELAFSLEADAPGTGKAPAYAR
ncbi:sugar ABC transporter ATP-binding protein [Pelagibacterium montanilacus]|uniref:sugar ABC transporter ATP-binding protein n=1 Tax=Pelagibacterium montanilacus TaxID=2185280 RepID=UPI001FE97B32|nr:sugar ABC transporter ATP-binding protein [Pelagibacterium montanilacus]